jgi:hypothetical protein
MEETHMGMLKAAASCLILAAATGAAGQEISPAEFERLYKVILPAADEGLWAQIPWSYDLHQARRQAAREGKPLCIWRMAGDPTGAC